MMTANISNINAVACVKKYLVEASMAHGLKFFIIRGIMASIFISNPIQTSNQWKLVITTTVAKTTVVKIMIEVMGFTGSI